MTPQKEKIKRTSQKKLSHDRRRFLQGSAGAMALAAMPMSTLTLFNRGMAAEPKTKKILSGSKWGVFHATIQDGEAVKFEPWELDPKPTPMLSGVRDSIYSDSRIRYPMVRRSWLEHGPGSHPEKRGKEEFVRVSWDKATKLVADELNRVKEQYGHQSVFGGSYGWKSSGKLHNCRTLLHRFLNVTMGGFVDGVGDYSTGAAQVILPYVTGSLEVYEQCTTYPVMKEHTELVVLWGCDPFNTCEIDWLIPDHGYYEGFKSLKEAGVKTISIDPVQTETNKFMEGEWIAPRSETDTALMLGIAHTLYSEDLHDQEFLDRYTVGFETFKAYLMGETDQTPKDAKWAAEICGLPQEKIKELARTFASHRTMFMLGWSTQRQQYGEQVPWMLVTLASMLGQIGLPGGGFGHSYHYCSAGEPTRSAPSLKSLSIKSPDLGSQQDTPEWLRASAATSIPLAQLVTALENPREIMHFNGSELELPLLKLAYWVGGNPFAHHQDRNKMLKAWENLETFIVHDFQWTATARHADIVLPATTSYERNDIETMGSYSMSHIVPMKKLVEPQFEARNEFDIFTDIASHLGKGHDFSEGRGEMDWLQSLYEGARSIARNQGMEMPVFTAFWEHNKPLAFPLKDEQKYFVRHAKFRENPALNPLGTDSGKIEIYSRAIEAYNYDDCPPHPTWIEPQEWAGGEKDRDYPLALISNHPEGRLHSQLCGTSFRETYAVAGREPCLIHPTDAKARGIKDGDVVRVFSRRGHILAGALISDEIMPGAIRVSEGGWYDPILAVNFTTHYDEDDKDGLLKRDYGILDNYGDVNVLTLDIPTSKLAQGNCGQSGVVEVEKYTGSLPEIKVFSQPDSL